MNTQNIISTQDVRADEKSASFEIDFKKINEKVKEVIEKYGGKLCIEFLSSDYFYMHIEEQPKLPYIDRSPYPPDYPVRLDYRQIGDGYILTISTTSSSYSLNEAIIYAEALNKAIQIISEAYDGLENYNNIVKFLKEQEKRKREEQIEKMKKLASEFNALSHVLKIWSFGNDKVKILLRRGDAEYDPRISSRIRAYTNFVLVVNNEEKSFYPSDFISQDNRVLRKKLLRECDYLLRAIQDVNERGKIAEQIADALLEMQKVRDEIYRKYNLCY